MGFGISPPNDRGSRPHTGGAIPGPLSRGSDPMPPNQVGGDRKNEESGKNPLGGAFPSPPNEHAPMPGHGGKM